MSEFGLLMFRWFFKENPLKERQKSPHEVLLKIVLGALIILKLALRLALLRG